MKNFSYLGTHATTFVVELNGRKLYIEQSGDKFEVSSDGGSFGLFGSFGKAVCFAEKQLVQIAKNNP